MTNRCATMALAVMLMTIAATAQQRGGRTALSEREEPSVRAVGWARALDGAPAELLTHGPATRITPADDATLTRPAWALSGTFAVAATFERTRHASGSGVYGLTVGTTPARPIGLAVLLRADGAVAVQRGTTRGAWQRSVAVRDRRADGTRLDRLEVRVTATDVRVLVNRHEIATLPIAAGELDGSPGVHVGAGGDVLVSGFTVERPWSAQ